MELAILAITAAAAVVAGGATAGLRAAGRTAKRAAVLWCEAVLTDANALLGEGRAAAAATRFTEAWAAVRRAWVLPPATRAALECRACAGCARAHLLLGNDGLDAAAVCAADACAAVASAGLPELARFALSVHVDVLAARIDRAAKMCDWSAALRLAMEAARLSATTDDEAIRNTAAAARHAVADGALAAAEAATLRGQWALARKTANTVFAASPPGEADGARARALAALKAVRAAEFVHHAGAAEAAVVVRAWAGASLYAKRAQELAHNHMERARAAAAAAAAAVGPFDEKLAAAVAAAATRRWAAALTACDAAVGAAPAGDNRRLAGLARVRATARAGTFMDGMTTADAHLAAGRWREAEVAAVEAQKYADTAADALPSRDAASRARAGARAAVLAARAAELSHRLVSAEAHMTAGRWREAEVAAVEAEKYADTAADALRSRDTASRARAGARAAVLAARADELSDRLAALEVHMAAGRWHDAEAGAGRASAFADTPADFALAAHAADRARAAAAAEPDYMDKVDAFIRHQRKSFRGDNPTGHPCPLAAIVQNCSKPACIPGSLGGLLTRHPDMFRVDMSAGGRVWVATLTPFRGAPSHRVWGEFRCPGACRKYWESAAS